MGAGAVQAHVCMYHVRPLHYGVDDESFTCCVHTICRREDREAGRLRLWRNVFHVWWSCRSWRCSRLCWLLSSDFTFDRYGNSEPQARLSGLRQIALFETRQNR